MVSNGFYVASFVHFFTQYLVQVVTELYLFHFPNIQYCAVTDLGMLFVVIVFLCFWNEESTVWDVYGRMRLSKKEEALIRK